MSALLELEGLSIRLPTPSGARTVVHEVDLQVEAGQIYGIAGESGSGKTMTMLSLLGLLPRGGTAHGRATFAGRDILAADKKARQALRGRDLSMVFQDPMTSLHPMLTVGKQLTEHARKHLGLSKAEAAARAAQMLEDVRIPDGEAALRAYPHEFSGGMRQRIAIAIALMCEPQILIADEPTTALDVTVQAEILDLLRRLRDETGTAIVLITHNMGVVADLADRVAVMLNGEVVETAPVAQLFAAPQHEYTTRLLAAVPRVQLVDRPLPASADATATPVVEAKGLVIEYPGRLGSPTFRAVHGIDFSIRPGEVLGLVGESGSGKTTIGRAIAGLTPVAGGSLRVLGTEMNGVRERVFRKRRKDLGFVFQDPATSFNPLSTIAQCVAEPLVVHGGARSAADARDKVDELLEAVQLPKAYGDRYPHELSGGQRQRASLARALALDPKLLVADEPTSALDVSVQARVLDLFAELQDRFGFATLFITHDLAVVDMLAHRVIVLHKGRIAEEGPTAEVLGDPQDPYTRRLIASLPVPDPTLQAERREAWRAEQAQRG